MSFQILFKLHLSPQRLVYFRRRHDSLFHQTMRENCHLAMEEVKDPVVIALQPYAKLVDPVTEVLSFRSPDFMAKLLETLDPHPTFVLSLEGKRIQPIEYGDCVGIFPVEDD